MGYRQLVRNLRKRDEAAARLISGFSRRWRLDGPNILGICTATNFDTGEVVCFRLKADGTAELMARGHGVPAINGDRVAEMEWIRLDNNTG